jgi:3-keto-5-aminohexanoate cleavage enzyme
MDEIIIFVAPYPGEKQTEKFPGKMNAADELIRCYNAGAAVAHLHVRDEEGLQTPDTTWFKRDIEAVRAVCPMVIEGSTGGTPDHTLEERCTSFTVPEVEMGSLNMGSINLFGGVYQNSTDDMRFYAAKLREHGVKPTLVCFDLSHFVNVQRLESEGLIEPPYHYGLPFSIPDSLPYQDRYLDLFLNELPEDCVWHVARHHAHGAADFRYVIERGGHVRVGYEDSPFLMDGRRAASNANLVEDVVKLAEQIGRRVVGAERARELLGLPPLKAVSA